MRIETDADVTTAVLEAMSRTPDPRIREVTQALVRHLHAFVREIRPSEQEFEQGLEYLARIGQAMSPTHNEAVLTSDVLGISTLVCLLNNGQGGATETAAALLGPFWRDNSPLTADGGSMIRGETHGPRLMAHCAVLAGGQPVADARVDVWHSSIDGFYENQVEDAPAMNLRGQLRTDAQGRFSFFTALPAGYPIPTHGPSGDMLRAQLRHPMRPAHLHFLIHKDGFKTLVTQVFIDSDPHLDSDVVFGVTSALIGDYRKSEKPAPDGSGEEFYELDYAFHLEPGEARLPAPPIA